MKTPKKKDQDQEKELSVEPVSEKPFAKEAREVLKIMDKWVILKSTFPSPYEDCHEAVRKFLEKLKKSWGVKYEKERYSRCTK